MPPTSSARPLRALIVSSHPLFREGLRRLMTEGRSAAIDIVGVATHTSEALQALERLKPDIIVVDYDDRAVQREEFLARFMEGESAMRVVFVSLQDAERAVVYDRHTLAAARVEDWLGGLAAGPAQDAGQGSAQDAGQGPAGAAVEAPHPSRRSSMRHIAIVAVLVVIVSLAVNFALDSIGLMPVEASAQAVVIDRLFSLHVKAISFLFALIVVFLGYSVVVFRRKPGETGDGDHIEGNTPLEIAWTLAPLAAVLAFSALGAQALAETRRTDPNAMQVNVIASQWNWRFEYPDTGIVSTELHLPVNRQVVLKITSEDVIHSFWVPEFRVKQDALPGENLVRELRITPTLVGDFKVRCAELCGTRHAYMENPVLVQSQADYDAWVAEQTFVSDDPVVRGEKWSTQFGCRACHSIDGTRVVGPSWQGLYGSSEALEGGATVTVDDAYLHESIVDPSAKLVLGYTDAMPKNFGQTMTEQQILDLIEYIKSLQGQ